MTCNDCIHSAMCTAITFIEGFKHGSIEEVCRHFKDKSRFVNLPCKPDSEIYSIFENGCEEIEKYRLEHGTLASFCIEDKLVSFYARYGSGLNYWHDIADFGKTVFLTKEEAEAKLKEMNENA